MKDKANKIIDKARDVVDDVEDEDKEELKDEKNDLDKNDEISENDLEKYHNDSNKDFVVFKGANKTVFFVPPNGWKLTDSTSDNISRNYGIEDGSEGFHIYTNKISKDFMEGYYREGMTVNEYQKTLEESNLNITEIYSVEKINNLPVGNAMKVVTTGLEVGVDVTYFWVTESEFLSLSFSGMPEDREELERLADEVAKGVVVVDGIK